MNTEEHLFIGFDCAYRTLGWCILGYNPRAVINCTDAEWRPDQLQSCLRNVFHLIGSGVEDVLGENIDGVDHSTRARRLIATLRRIIPPNIVSRAKVVIERQPRKRGRAFGNSAVHDSNQTIEAQLIYHFSVVCPAACVYLVSAGKKNRISCQLLNEERVGTYVERKKQTRRAFVRLAEHFNFDICPYARTYKHVRADQADACIQIIAAIFLCAKNIGAIV